jgi:hypothetical protein
MSERLNQLDLALAACPSWPRFAAEIGRRIDELTLKLIGENNEQTRGAIKELRRLIDLPATLQVERDHLAAALSEPSDAAQ